MGMRNPQPLTASYHLTEAEKSVPEPGPAIGFVIANDFPRMTEMRTDCPFYSPSRRR